MATDDSFSVRRIVLALDSTADTSVTLRAAAELAARLHADLSAIFVVDENLYRSAALPFVHRLHRASTHWEAFDTTAMEQALQRRAAIARRDIEAEARRRRVTWSFDVVRGTVESHVMSLAEAADLLVLGGAAQSHAGGLRLASRRRVAAKARGPMLLLGPQGRLARFFAVVYDGSPAADKALAAATQLAGGAPLAILVLGKTMAEIDTATERARESLGTRNGRVRFLPLLKADISRICALVASFGENTVLVMHADLPILETDDGADALERIKCPVLIIR